MTGNLAPEYGVYNGIKTTGSFLSISKINPTSFAKGAVVNLMATCNAATGTNSVVEQFSRILDPSSKVTGYAGYINFYTHGPDTDRQLGSTTHWSTRHRLSALMHWTNPWKSLDPITVHGNYNK